MTEVNVSDFDKICRGCLCKNGEMRPLYGSCLDKMLGAVAEIDISTEGLPETLCVPCVLQVSRAFTFKQRCRRSDLLLRRALEKHKTNILESDSIQTNQQTQQIDDAISKDSDCAVKESETENSNEEFSTEVSIDENAVDDGVSDDTDANISASSKYQDYIDDVRLDVGNDISLNENTAESFDEHSIIGTNSSTDDIMTEVFGAFESVDKTISEENAIAVSQSNVSPPLQNETFECLICQKVFAKKKILTRHLKIHNPNKPHVCTFSACNMSFAEKSNLRKHEKKHTGELRNVQDRNYLCQFCHLSFKYASSLSKHEKHHTKHNIFNCPYCPKYYVERRSLNIHLRSHTGDRPYKCSCCNKGFTQQGNLKKHMRIHTGSECKFCQKLFSTSNSLKVHMKTHIEKIMPAQKQQQTIVHQCTNLFSSAVLQSVDMDTYNSGLINDVLICTNSI